MKCPYCAHPDTKVTDSRLGKEGAMIRRRRECEACERRFTTYERVEDPLPMVVKKDGRRESFEPQKVLNGVRRACEKRPVSMEQIESLVSRVERWAIDLGEAEVQAAQIGEQVMNELRSLDEVAYVRFASVYRSFKDITEFMNELGELLNKQKDL